jgi:hypothetical protein
VPPPVSVPMTSVSVPVGPTSTPYIPPPAYTSVPAGPAPTYNAAASLSQKSLAAVIPGVAMLMAFF